MVKIFKKMKEKFAIKGFAGEKKLNGKIAVRGSKNAVLPLMAAAVLCDSPAGFDNVPEIEDVLRMSELLQDLGAKVENDGQGSLKIHGENLKKTDLDHLISKRFRASIILSGPILARYGKISFPHPGGCVIGARPIDLFIQGFEKMGAKIEFADDRYSISAPKGKLSGAEIFFKMQSVSATETFLMAATLAEGKTVLKNVAVEPEVLSLIDFLVLCGAKIKGRGTTTLEITGGGLLKAPAKKYATIPDRIEAGCFLILGALCADNLEITDCNPSDLEILIEILRESGMKIETEKNKIILKDNAKIKNSELKAVSIKTHEYPGFPTDLQAPMTVFLTQVSGEGLVFETIFEGRLNYTQDIVKMGADIKMWDAHRATVKGPTPLKGKELEGPDIRAGLAFVIAAIVAKGDSIINNIYFIDRGYEKVEDRLKKIGVDIERVEVCESVPAEAVVFAANAKEA